MKIHVISFASTDGYDHSPSRAFKTEERLEEWIKENVTEEDDYMTKEIELED